MKMTYQPKKRHRIMEHGQKENENSIRKRCTQRRRLRKKESTA